ncbi:hypothetical protein QAD02_009017 [Eretmocerus hayati]|uniref:Uncharacterized protein n=1 Tax=Eretmocerus hayati TaxID=131215 RepID=A0ACC2N828_9HYME|nr:hypothetical protein QAD02_009017 [Eretmocerus hayati]
MPPTILTLQMIVDYAEEKNWKQVVFFDCIDDEDCNRPYARPLVDCFMKKEILVSIKSFTKEIDLSRVLRTELYKVGVVLLIDDIDLDRDDNLLRKVMTRNKGLRSLVLGEYTSWLVLSTKWNNTQIFDAMREWPIGIDSDITIAMSFLSSEVILSVLHQFSNNTCEELRNYGHSYDYARLSRSQSVSPPEMTFVQDTDDASKTIMVFYMVSVYKIRVDGNASLEKENWNTWSPSRGFVNEMNLPRRRSNLWHHSMNFGLQNSSSYYRKDSESNNPHDNEHISIVESLTELINLFEICLNVSANITNYVYYEIAQIAKDNDELVHGITSGDIDIGASFLDVDLNRNKLLDFSFPILHFTRSIYFQPPETSNNIFLLPFDRKLFLSVAGTLILIVAVMELINFVTVFIHWKEDKEHFGLGEALIWCFSIMCMQGSPWTPTTRAGKAVLLASLLFALIMYNSYSGSITSILSVKTESIKDVSDFYSYHYTIGSTKIDDTDILTNTTLRPFYFRAMEKNHLENSEKRGLQKALQGKFAFSAANTEARRIFRTGLIFKRCLINELATDSTGTLALPIAINSPFKKIINLSILRMWQHGILRKLTLKMKPPLLECGVRTSRHRGASFMDVYGAFCILAFGALISFVLFSFERGWARGRRFKAIVRSFQQNQRRSDYDGYSAWSREFRRRRDLLPRGRPEDVLLTARLPIKILGLEEEFRKNAAYKM